MATVSLQQIEVNLSAEDIAAVGKKIWQNECGGEISGLTHWNAGENFPSLGIGHCIWYVAGKEDIHDESFPNLIRFLQRHLSTQEHIIKIPAWLDQPKVPACPWQNCEEFLKAKEEKDPNMLELQQLLTDTIPLQMEYLIYRTKTVLSEILELFPTDQRQDIFIKLQQLMKSPIGIYSLVDYINFKGDGIKEYKNCPLPDSLDETQLTLDISTTTQIYYCGWGLVQVLKEIIHAPKDLTINQAFAWAAEKTLTRRVNFAPPERKANDQKWLPGWRKRVNTYKDN